MTSTSPLRKLACHMGSHRFTCHPPIGLSCTHWNVWADLRLAQLSTHSNSPVATYHVVRTVATEVRIVFAFWKICPTHRLPNSRQIIYFYGLSSQTIPLDKGVARRFCESHKLYWCEQKMPTNWWDLVKSYAAQTPTCSNLIMGAILLIDTHSLHRD